MKGKKIEIIGTIGWEREHCSTSDFRSWDNGESRGVTSKRPAGKKGGKATNPSRLLLYRLSLTDRMEIKQVGPGVSVPESDRGPTDRKRPET